MDRDEAITLLRGGEEGVREWNQKLREGQELPVLDNAFFLNSDLRGVDLRGTCLINASFIRTDLRGADLTDAQLVGADLRHADLRGACLRHANVYAALFGGTLISCDLSTTRGLGDALHSGPSFLDVSVPFAAGVVLPEPFLVGCGVPPRAAAEMLKIRPDRYGTKRCFVCHCLKDERLAHRFVRDLRSHGILTWPRAYDLSVYDDSSPTENDLHLDRRMILIASRDAMTMDLVNRELQEIYMGDSTLQNTPARSGEGLRRLLIHFVRTDNFMFEQNDDGTPRWRHPFRDKVLNSNIVDAVGWPTQPSVYPKALGDLIKLIHE